MYQKNQLAIVSLCSLIVLWGCGGDKKETPPRKSSAPPVSPAVEQSEGYQSVNVADGGTISGKVLFTGNWKPVTMPVSKDQQVCGKTQQDPSLVLDGQGGVRNALVRITGHPKGKEYGGVAASVGSKGLQVQAPCVGCPCRDCRGNFE